MPDFHEIAVMPWSRVDPHHTPAHIPPQPYVLAARNKYLSVSKVRADHIRLCGLSEPEASMSWDFGEGQNHKWTIREALLTQSFIPTPPSELVNGGSESLNCELNLLVSLMWHLGYGLVNHSHLCKSDLYCRLYYKILDEPCLMIFGDNCREMIDCLHSMDDYEGSGVHDRVYSRDKTPERYGDVWDKMPLAPESAGEHGCWFLQPGDRIIG